jgi:hypothetical protein
MRSLALLLLLSVAAAPACKRKRNYEPTFGPSTSAPKDEQPVATVKTPPTLVWKEEQYSAPSATFKELPGVIGKFNLFDHKYSIRFEKLPKGTVLAVGDKQDTTQNETIGTSLDVDVSEQLGGMSVKDMHDREFKMDPKLTVELRFVGGVTVKIEAPKVGTSYALGKILAEAANHPVLFGDENEETPRDRRSIVSSQSGLDVYGAARTVKELHWVAVEHTSGERPDGVCSGYNKSGTLPRVYVDKEVVIYERKTAKEVARKEFKGSGSCPMMAFNGKATIYPDSDQIKGWLRQQRATLK